ncbi:MULTISPECIES: helix-turn-helix domain-containing protein [unclassified Streptomyces]|uniref:helix-turn-helix domain-containing protein n=1 Tax=unclassified Streptomyces TaxID=2593676 RepID=UPI0004C0B5F3|nr:MULTISPECIES: helix-turn-helix transcriptional regulator [unclassified Streptomyces]
MGEFRARVRAALTEQRMSMRSAARTLNYDVAYLSRVLNGKQSPSLQLAEGLDRLLGMNGELGALVAHPVQAGNISSSERRPALDGDRGEGFASAIRDMSQRLVVLDNAMNGLPVADVAARAFKSVYRQIGDGEYDRKAEHDIQAAAAELAEVAGWALFDAEKHDSARRFNQEALFLAKLSGDHSIELLVMQNMAMQAGWVGRPREELAIARSIIEQGRLSPHTEAIFRVREAKGLAASGQESEAARLFDLARSLIQESKRCGDPYWAWWVTAAEIDGHQGFALQEAGQWKKGIPYLQRALHDDGGVKVGYRNISAVRLLDCLLRAAAWPQAEELAQSIVPTIGETASVRTLRLLSKTAQGGMELAGAPMGVRDLLHTISDALNGDPYAF